jgi:GNAT superfamily N-acetyltransferase
VSEPGSDATEGDAADSDATDVPALPGYVEPGRSYRSVWLLGLVLLAGFGVDLALDVHGAVAHLPGWIVAAVLVLGIDLLVVYAARATKSLTLDSHQLAIGEDAVDRSAIVSSLAGADDELPVLGWPTGMPRGMQAITLRLVDGREVVVPTRRPAQLRAVLGHGGVGATPDTGRDVLVRAAETADLDRVPEIADRAEAVFRVAGYDLPPIPFDVDGLSDAVAVFVAGRPPVGFVQVDEVDGAAHVAELGVLPSAMRRGVGGRLLEHACAWAEEHGYAAVTLITFADVAWNAPFYGRHGFVEAPADTPELARRRARQTELGLDEVGRRIVMRRRLRP